MFVKSRSHHRSTLFVAPAKPRMPEVAPAFVHTLLTRAFCQVSFDIPLAIE